MTAETTVRIFYGPLGWFDEQIGTGERQYLVDIVNEHDEARRRITHVVEGQEVARPEDSVPRPQRVVAESSDYASLQEHAVMNFIGLVRSMSPEELLLHNPPAHIHTQLERELSTEVVRYAYPTVSKDTLVRLNSGFSDHLVGQASVKEALLAALYPLISSARDRPIVVMLYGPSGVGKTETAQLLNDLLGGRLLRKQFSMYQNDKFASYVFGGSHAEPSFARDLLDRESGVILIDEFDKANAVFHSAFYQLFDGGAFEDKNYSVEVGPALIICTSNYNSENEIREAVGDALFSRFDSLIRFESLSEPEVRKVIDRLVDRRLDHLTAEEKCRVDNDELRSMLYPLAGKYGNVRKLGKIVNEVISLILVRALLADEELRETSELA